MSVFDWAQTFSVVVATVVTVVQLWRGKKLAAAEVVRNRGEAAEAISAAATTLVAPLTKRVTDLETSLAKSNRRIRKLEIAVNRLLAGIEQLRQQVITLGAEPVFDPKTVELNGENGEHDA